MEIETYTVEYCIAMRMNKLANCSNMGNERYNVE